MKKFEYRIITAEEFATSEYFVMEDRSFLKKLNKLGLDGWELIMRVPPPENNAHSYFFKREIK